MGNAYQEFVKKLQDDTGLQNELRARFGDPAAGIPSQDLAAFAASKGYKFSVEELAGELSDSQLNAVSGGALFIKFDGIQPQVRSYDKVYLNFGALFNKKV